MYVHIYKSIIRLFLKALRDLIFACQSCTINNFNPPYMKEIFTQNTIRNPERKRLLVKATNTKRYGTDSLRHLGPKIWNCLSQDIKDSSSLSIFKSQINTWSGPSCNCAACS